MKQQSQMQLPARQETASANATGASQIYAMRSISTSKTIRISVAGMCFPSKDDSSLAIHSFRAVVTLS